MVDFVGEVDGGVAAAGGVDGGDLADERGERGGGPVAAVVAEVEEGFGGGNLGVDYYPERDENLCRVLLSIRP